MENMPYLVVAAGKESEENDCPLVRLSVQVAADWRVNIEERRGLVIIGYSNISAIMIRFLCQNDLIAYIFHRL